ncbi:MAG: glycoside hydrolase family 3 protein, partial [Anaerolineae bacterium]|nr:glycoside hydrolase family 3 protein [Anaerolineae bacterium]
MPPHYSSPPHRPTQKRRLSSLAGAFLLLFAFVIPRAYAAPPRQATAQQRVEAILAGMNTTELVAQLFMVSLWGPELSEEAVAFLETYNPGGVVLFGDNAVTPEQITDLTNTLQLTGLRHPDGLPAWIAIDQEGGVVTRLPEGFTTFPLSMAIAGTGDPAYARAIGQAMAEELRAIGITMNLAPVADLETNPDNPIIARRSFGADPELVGEMVAAIVDGMQSGGVMATAKHFPGHGETTSDSHLSLPMLLLDRTRIDSVELIPFEYAIDANVGAIMAGHLWYPALDPAPESPASLSYPVLSHLLRQELGFTGLIMTDALDMDAIDVRYGLPQAAVMAIQAGADLVTPGPHVGLHTQQAAIDAVVVAVNSGLISQARIVESVRRVLLHKIEYGVLDWTPLDPAGAEARLNRAAHEAVVADVLAAAVTLVYDNANYVPLDPARRTAFIYPATNPGLAQSCLAYAPDLDVVGVSLYPTG